MPPCLCIRQWNILTLLKQKEREKERKNEKKEGREGWKKNKEKRSRKKVNPRIRKINVILTNYRQ